MIVEFIKSASMKDGFINDSRKKIVMVGRSNVGKSSLINAVANNGSPARVSSSPGKTTTVNYYMAGKGKAYFIDLPGYGYAKAEKKEKARWAVMMDEFFRHLDPETALGALVVDIRHKPMDSDVQMARCFKDFGLPFFVAGNKCDKLKPREIAPAVALIKETLGVEDVVPFSAITVSGKKALLKQMGLL